MENSKQNIGLMLAIEKGYRTDNGTIVSSRGNTRKLRLVKRYPTFSVKLRRSRRVIDVGCHRLAAYEKFGEAMFSDGIVVRHGPLGPMNFTHENISIGTHSDNQMDRAPLDRVNHSILASNKIRKFTDAEMESIKSDRRSGMTYRQLMSKYKISSKGTVSFMVNNSYVTKK